MRIEWDSAKSESNKAKHGIAFERAQLVFDDPPAGADSRCLESAFPKELLFCLKQGADLRAVGVSGISCTDNAVNLIAVRTAE